MTQHYRGVHFKQNSFAFDAVTDSYSEVIDDLITYSSRCRDWYRALDDFNSWPNVKGRVVSNFLRILFAFIHG